MAIKQPPTIPTIHDPGIVPKPPYIPTIPDPGITPAPLPTGYLPVPPIPAPPKPGAADWQQWLPIIAIGAVALFVILKK